MGKGGKKKRLPLEDARLEREGQEVLVVLGKHRTRVASLRSPQSYGGSVWQSGETDWDEVELFLAGDRLAVVHREWTDVHLAGNYLKEQRWKESKNGSAWRPSGEPSGDKRLLGKVKS